ncbi:MAG: GNAT family N-acetyltransferase [Chryseobacterium sp.]|nr:GNAT family N-acetyltransferase [Chryseobacterium sp.]
MEFINIRNGNGGFITLNKEADEVGRLTYTIFPDDHKLIISFVLVHPKFGGRGMGKYLVEDAIKFARENKWNVYPHCSYARSVMRRMTDVEDVFLES